jgi:hypothetical protein
LDRIRSPSSWRLSLLAALASFAGLAATGVVAHLLPAARARDAESLGGFTALEDRPRLAALAESIARLGDPLGYGLIGGALVAWALARRRPRTAAAVAVVLVATGVTTRLLKPLVDSPRAERAPGRRGGGHGPGAGGAHGLRGRAHHRRPRRHGDRHAGGRARPLPRPGAAHRRRAPLRRRGRRQAAQTAASAA